MAGWDCFSAIWDNGGVGPLRSPRWHSARWRGQPRGVERCSPLPGTLLALPGTLLVLPEPLLATAEPAVATCTKPGLAPAEPAGARQPAAVPTPDRVSPPPTFPRQNLGHRHVWMRQHHGPATGREPETHSAARNSLSSPKLVPRRVNANRRASFVRHFAHVMADKPDSGPHNRAPSGLSASPGPSRPARQFIGAPPAPTLGNPRQSPAQ